MALSQQKAMQKIPPAKDLRDELEEALQGDFEFDGSFYCATKLSKAPNPCLNIEGAGPIGPPLSEWDAKFIIHVAKQAPFGHGTKTVVDTKVRDTWEIEPHQIKFENQEWTQFVEKTVVETVWTSLGVAQRPNASFTSSCCTKLGLTFCLTKSTFNSNLPQSAQRLRVEYSTQKAPGMFATAVVLLPSPYQGGQVHVTHASKTEVIDFSATSHLSTSVLAWYTDVTHEVKPIMSGYRLALSYNLIHTSHPDTIPHVPGMDDAVSEVRTVLEKWRLSPFKDEKREKNLLAYILDHEYNNLDLAKGAASLKGQDAHMVAHVRVAAEQTGYLVLLGALEYHLQGSGDDEGRGGFWGKRGRYYDSDSDDMDDYDDEDVGFLEIYERNLKVENVVDLNGDDIIGKRAIRLSEENLIPKDPFEDEEPDEREYEGYMGNGAGSLDHWYRRSVVMFVHKDDAEGIFLRAGGISYALAKLLSTNPDQPGEEGKRLIEFLIKNLSPKDKTITWQVANYAVRWSTPENWRRIVGKPGNTLTTFKIEGLVSAMRTFGFDEVRSSFEILFQRPQPLKDRLEFLDAVASEGNVEHPTKVVFQWCTTWSFQALRNLGSLGVADLPSLVKVARSHDTDLSFSSKEILPQLAQRPDFFDITASFASLMTEAPAHSDFKDEHRTGFLNQCLDVLVKQCDPIQAYNTQHYPYQANRMTEAHLTKYFKVIDLAICYELLEPCSKLCQRLLEIPGKFETTFTSVYRPFIPLFVALCKQRSFDPITPPFDDLLRRLVSSYLHSVLGSSSKKYLSKIKSLGCGCEFCNELDQFINKPAEVEHRFKLLQAQRKHLEGRMRAAWSLVTCETIRSGSPHTLLVTKQPDVVSAQQWPARLTNAKAFLANIGDDTVIARLMGERYPEVQLALEGTKRFAEMPRTNAPEGSAAGASDVLEETTNAIRVQQPQAGAQKRKRVENLVNLGVIDLT